MSRPIITIDKNIFQVISEDDFIKLIDKYTVILPHALFEECLTTKARNPLCLLKKAENVIKAGAFISYPRGRMFEIEKNTLKPLDSIIDKEGTIQIRENHIDKLDIDFSGEAQKCNRLFEQKILTVKNLLNAFWETLSEKEYSKDWKKQDSEDNDIENRFRKWEACCDETQIIQWSKKFSPGIRCDINKYWISWQLVRVLLIYGIEWAYKRNLSGQTFENFNIENDVYDIEYVLCMHHSDALLSNDKKLVIPLTKVLYPEKAIYSNLEECL